MTIVVLIGLTVALAPLERWLRRLRAQAESPGYAGSAYLPATIDEAAMELQLAEIRALPEAGR